MKQTERQAQQNRGEIIASSWLITMRADHMSKLNEWYSKPRTATRQILVIQDCYKHVIVVVAGLAESQEHVAVGVGALQRDI